MKSTGYTAKYAHSSVVKADLEYVYGDKALAYPTVTRPIRLLKGGRTKAKDAPRAGRSLSAVSERDIEVVKTAIE